MDLWHHYSYNNLYVPKAILRRDVKSGRGIAADGKIGDVNDVFILELKKIPDTVWLKLSDLKWLQGGHFQVPMEMKLQK